MYISASSCSNSFTAGSGNILFQQFVRLWRFYLMKANFNWT